MLVIVTRPDFPAIRDLFVVGSESSKSFLIGQRINVPLLGFLSQDRQLD
jgi:hypothetical protein